MFKNPVPVQAQNETTIDYMQIYTICIERERDSWQSIVIHQPGFPETREIPPLDHLWGSGSAASLQFAQIDLSSPYLSLSIYIGLLSIVDLHQTSPAWETLGRQLTTLNQRRNPSKKVRSRLSGTLTLSKRLSHHLQLSGQRLISRQLLLHYVIFICQKMTHTASPPAAKAPQVKG